MTNEHHVSLLLEQVFKEMITKVLIISIFWNRMTSYAVAEENLLEKNRWKNIVQMSIKNKIRFTWHFDIIVQMQTSVNQGDNDSIKLFLCYDYGDVIWAILTNKILFQSDSSAIPEQLTLMSKLRTSCTWTYNWSNREKRSKWHFSLTLDNRWLGNSYQLWYPDDDIYKILIKSSFNPYLEVSLEFWIQYSL